MTAAGVGHGRQHEVEHLAIKPRNHIAQVHFNTEIGKARRHQQEPLFAARERADVLRDQLGLNCPLLRRLRRNAGRATRWPS